jgi:hypothetical protein
VVQGARWQRIAAWAAPFVTLATVHLGLVWTLSGGSVLKRACATLAAGVFALCISGLLVSQELFSAHATRRALASALAALCLGWIWQRAWYLLLIPERFLKYGYFLTPSGRRARLVMLELPFALVCVALALSLGVALRAAWHAGARGSVMLLLVWWLTAFVVFALPSLYLYIQGDAAIFI